MSSMASCLKLFSVKLLGVKALADMDTGQMWRLWFSKAGHNLSWPTNPFLPILPNFNADSAQTQQVYQMTSEFCSSWCSWHLGDRGSATLAAATRAHIRIAVTRRLFLERLSNPFLLRWAPVKAKLVGSGTAPARPYCLLHDFFPTRKKLPKLQP